MYKQNRSVKIRRLKTSVAVLKCEGGQLDLECLQRSQAHCFLREWIPQYDRSGEETVRNMRYGLWFRYQGVPGTVRRGCLPVGELCGTSWAGLISVLQQGVPT